MSGDRVILCVWPQSNLEEWSCNGNVIGGIEGIGEEKHGHSWALNLTVWSQKDTKESLSKPVFPKRAKTFYRKNPLKAIKYISTHAVVT